MESSLEVLIPARNPGEVFRGTIDSLLAQSDRRFTVLISDNFSVGGTEGLAAAAEKLREGGLPTRIIRPPWEMGRVQHWNWLHHQSEADWLKPLFVGDSLEPDCFRACRAAIQAHPDLGFLFFGFHFQNPDGGRELALFRDSEGRIDPGTVPRRCMSEGNFFGGPVNVLYRRAAFQTAGGHLTSLPYLADFDLYARLAMQVPAWVIPQPLATFLRHEQRFTKGGSGTRRESMNAEQALEYALLRYAAAQAGYPVNAGAFAGPFARALRSLGLELVWRRLRRWRKRRAGT